MIKSKFQSNLILLLLLLLCFYFNLTFLKENPNSTSISTSPLTLTRFVIVKKNLNRKNISGTAKRRYRCRVGYNPHRNWSKYKRGGNERVSLQSQSQIESGPRHALASSIESRRRNARNRDWRVKVCQIVFRVDQTDANPRRLRR